MVTSPPPASAASAAAFFASSSILFLTARRSSLNAFRRCFPVLAFALTRARAASCFIFAPRFAFNALLFALSRALSVFFFLFCHPGAVIGQTRRPSSVVRRPSSVVRRPSRTGGGGAAVARVESQKVVGRTQWSVGHSGRSDTHDAPARHRVTTVRVLLDEEHTDRGRRRRRHTRRRWMRAR